MEYKAKTVQELAILQETGRRGPSQKFDLPPQGPQENAANKEPDLLTNTGLIS